MSATGTEKSGRQCPCGGVLGSHKVKAGKAYSCASCGRYEVVHKDMGRNNQIDKNEQDKKTDDEH